MTCNDASRILHLDRPGERNEQEERALSEHLRNCTSCQEEMALLRRTSDSMNRFTRSRVPSVHIGAEAGMIMNSIRSSETHASRVLDAIMRFTGFGPVRVGYAVASLFAVVTLTLQLSERIPEDQSGTRRHAGIYITYSIDTEQIPDMQNLPLPEILMSTLLEKPRLDVRKTEMKKALGIIGRTAARVVGLNSAQRESIDQIIASMQHSVKPSIRLGRNGGSHGNR